MQEQNKHMQLCPMAYSSLPAVLSRGTFLVAHGFYVFSSLQLLVLHNCVHLLMNLQTVGLQNILWVGVFYMKVMCNDVVLFSLTR